MNKIVWFPREEYQYLSYFIGSSVVWGSFVDSGVWSIIVGCVVVIGIWAADIQRQMEKSE